MPWPKSPFQPAVVPGPGRAVAWNWRIRLAGGQLAGDFRVRIAAAAFAGRSRLERHRLIHAALGQELAGGIHALAIEAEPA